MIHVVGAAGTLLVLAAYFLVSMGRIPSTSAAYQGLNIVGACLLAFYGAVLFAWASVALNAIWAAIGLVALWRLVRARRAASQRTSA